ncbi:hypothetical protein pb186bvf_001537 [Paramecium bursaria]
MPQQFNKRDPQNSVMLQKILFFDYYFTVLFFSLIAKCKIEFTLIEIVVFLYKGYALYYPQNNVGIEVFLMFLLIVMQFARLYMGRLGNLTEQSSYLLWFFILSLPCILFFIYFITLQTYIIILEFIIGIMMLIFMFFELIFATFTYQRFYKMNL